MRRIPQLILALALLGGSTSLIPAPARAQTPQEWFYYCSQNPNDRTCRTIQRNAGQRVDDQRRDNRRRDDWRQGERRGSDWRRDDRRRRYEDRRYEDRNDWDDRDDRDDLRRYDRRGDLNDGRTPATAVG